MMSKKSPQLRFEGFTDDWEQRKFKEIINERREKTKVENEVERIKKFFGISYSTILPFSSVDKRYVENVLNEIKKLI